MPLFYPEPIFLNGKFRRSKRYNWPNGNKKYVGYHVQRSSALTAIEWEIYKWDQNGSGADEPIEGPIKGAVNSLAVIDALAWNT